MNTTAVNYWLSKEKVPQRLESVINQHLDAEVSLDLGCGGGRLFHVLPGRLYGIDQSKLLVQETRVRFPSVTLVCGDFQKAATWESLPQFDLIVSNCAIRKDYCPHLDQIANMCREHLTGTLILRMQAENDLDFLPKRLGLFYNEKEIRRAFGDVRVVREHYEQRFSSEEYARKFLSRIMIQYGGSVPKMTVRRYYLVEISR